MTIRAPDLWLKATLDQVGRWRTGGTPSKSHAAYWANGTIPWASPKDFKQTFIGTATDKVTQQAVDDAGLHLIPVGSILFVTRSGILARTLPIAVTTVPVVINQDVKALTLASDVDPLFLYYQLSFRSDNILRRALKLGTTVQSIDFSVLRQTEVALPPLSEQQAIVGRLDAIGASLRNARAQLSGVFRDLDAYERAVQHEALAARDGENGSSMEAIDHGLVELGDIANIQSGLTLGKRHGAVELVSRPYLRVANVQRGRLDLEDVKEVLVSPVEAERYKLVAGDILMNEGGDRDKLGRGWVWREEIPGCLHQNHVFRVRLKDKDFPPEFVSLYANEAGRDYFLSEAKQTTNLASISKSRLSRLPITLPGAETARTALRVLDRHKQWTSALRTQTKAIDLAAEAAWRAANRKAFEGQLAPRAIDQAVPLLAPPQLTPQSTPPPKGSRDDKGPKMDTLTNLLSRWPAKGMTFEGLQNLFPSDYEILKDAVFELLAGEKPELEQQFDPDSRVMRFVKRST